jgi:hypothetical protein
MAANRVSAYARAMWIALLLMLALLGCHAAAPEPGSREAVEAYVRQLDAYPKPPAALLDQVERRLQDSPCIGDISRWNRQYTYGLTDRKPDESQIYFKLMLAGRLGIEPGRRADMPGATIMLDDTPIKMAVGEFDQKTGKVKLEFCSSNVPGADAR